MSRDAYSLCDKIETEYVTVSVQAGVLLYKRDIIKSLQIYEVYSR